MKDFDLDQPLLTFTSNKQTSVWTTRHAVEGVQIFGGVGSGKSSGSFAMLAKRMLLNNFGGLVLTVKADEREIFQEYCRITNREKDLVIISPNGPHKFNLLQYETEKSENAITENIVEVLKTVIKAGEEKSSGKSDDKFWDTALDSLLFNSIDLCLLAYGKISIRNLYDIVQNIPAHDDDTEVSNLESEGNAYHLAFQAARKNINEKVTQWFISLPLAVRNAMKEDGTYESEVERNVPETRLYNIVQQFFNNTYIPMSGKTRSIIDFSFTGFLYRFLREPFYSIFCQGDSNITPEDCLDGKIILIDMPVKIHHKIGRDCQILFKYIWQRAMEKRSIRDNNRPVFLFADEAQELIHEKDALFQATARSNRIATVYVTQNIPNYKACMGGDKSLDRVNSLLGTFGTKIFHANADIETNKYASELIGDAYVWDESFTTTIAENLTRGRGQSLKLERIIKPEDFNKLRTGGAHNNFQAEGYMHYQGSGLFSGANHQKLSFIQNYIP